VVGSLVGIGAAQVFVCGWWCVRFFGGRVGLVEPIFEDVVDHLEVDAWGAFQSFASCLQALLLPVRPQPEDADAGAERLLGEGFGCQDMGDRRKGRRAYPLGQLVK
jgi:hypothetical protein